MQAFLKPLEDLSEYNSIRMDLQNGYTPVQLSGSIETQRSHLIYGLGKNYKYRIIIAANERKARELYSDYRLYEKDALFYPAKDIIFYSADIHGKAITEERLKVVRRLLEGAPATIITTADAGMEHVLPLSFLKKSPVRLCLGDTINLEKLKKQLVQLGYEYEAQVAGKGQFSARGGIIDIFPLTEDTPYRIELWDDEVDTIRTFDVESQRSIENVDDCLIYPATEILMSKDRLVAGLHKIEQEQKKITKNMQESGYVEEGARLKKAVDELKSNIDIYGVNANLESFIQYFYEETESFFEYFAEEDTIYFMDEPERCREKLEAVEIEFRESMQMRMEKGYILPGQAKLLYSKEQTLAMLAKRRLLIFSTLDTKPKGIDVVHSYALQAHAINAYNKHFEMLVDDMKRWKSKGYRVLFLAGSRTRAARLSEDLNYNELQSFYSEDYDRELSEGEIMVVSGKLRKGFEYPSIKFVVVTESDIFGEEKKKSRRKKYRRYSGDVIKSFTDLSVGDYVVHENYGLGVYKGIEKIDVDKVSKDYVKIEYADGGNLYVLATNLDALQKYAGQDARKPKLNKLNSAEWKKTKSRVKAAVNEVAKELVELYAKRQAKSGYAFSQDTVWQKEFEELFEFEETDDQISAIEATKKDMESSRIMDRLVCGDVGYGKTEIAIRAAFKAVNDSKQVAILVPTTILAEQHYNTLLKRFEGFPVSVEMLSRFRTPTQQKKTIEKLRTGQIDIVVGTHRMLSKDIVFHDLGLLIVDEEQRFGVTHKEKIKQLKDTVDVLTLSATPIPRTLHMSLVGIRDMSLLEEPPIDRLPIQTFVLEHNDEMIREAINRELARGGQVYYVYNRVNNIDEVAMDVAGLVPDARVEFAHGQMSERQLETIMKEFIDGEIDVLVATTIIETGLDISNVNTMIIDDADRLGLSQLYQLRGRVGRSNRTAYAFLMYKRDKMLKEVAEKRLQAIKEFTELGSGFKVAMRDLELRGAGNLLGEAQHGHMEAVGYDLYCKMLNDAVLRQKGETKEEEEYDTVINVKIDAYIPPAYIKNEFQKLDMYRRIACIRNKEEYMDMQEELTDRFGDLPSVVEKLLRISLVKADAHAAGITQIRQVENEIHFYMYPKANIDVMKIDAMLGKYHGILKMAAGKDKEPYFCYTLPKGKLNNMISAKKCFAIMDEVVADITGLKAE